MNNPSFSKPPQHAVGQLGYIGLGVSDLEAWRSFATDVLGLGIAGTGQDGSLFLRMDEYHHRFEIIPNGLDDIAFVGWEVADAEQMAGIAEQARAYGVEVIYGSEDDALHRKVLGLIKFKDPDGVELEVYHGPSEEYDTFHSPRQVTGFLASELGVGHIVLHVKDRNKSLDFYQKVLGVRITDHIDFDYGPKPLRVTFTHVNQRHHSLAFMEPPPAMMHQRLSHFMLEMGTIDDVGSTWQLFGKHGLFVGELGRHTNDQMFSFYGRSPSGFMVEVGCDGKLVDVEGEWPVRLFHSASSWGHGFPPAAKTED